MLRLNSLIVVLVMLAGIAATVESTAAPVERIGLALVPPDVTFVLSVRPVEIAARDELRDIDVVRFVDDMVPLKEAKLSMRDVRELMIIKYGELHLTAKLRFVVRFEKPAHREQFVDSLVEKHGMQKIADSEAWEDGSERVEAIDESTLVIDHIGSIEPIERPEVKNAAPRWAEAWQRRSDRPVLLAVDVQTTLKTSGNEELLRFVNDEITQTVYPLFLWVDWAVADVQLNDTVQLEALVQSFDAEKAETVRDTLEAVTVFAQNFARLQERMVFEVQGQPEIAKQLEIRQQIIKEVGHLLPNAKFEAEGSRVNATLKSSLTAADIGNFTMKMLPTVQGVREQVRRQVSQNNMMQLGLAMHNYESAQRQFPAAVSYTYRKGGQELRSEHPHSWRVDVLPYLEEGPRQLEEYHYDEPWDSEANKKFLARMPGVFRSPHDKDPNSTNTSVFVLTGPDTLFKGDENTAMRQITDGTSRTILLVEAKRAVPWTKPEDIPYDPAKPLPKLGGWVRDHFFVGLADGSVIPVSSEIPEATLRPYITKAGGEAIGELPAFRER